MKQDLTFERFNFWTIKPLNFDAINWNFVTCLRQSQIIHIKETFLYGENICSCQTVVYLLQYKF